MPDQNQINAFITLMETAGITVDDLTAGQSSKPTETISDRISTLLNQLNINTRRTYRTHLLRFREGLADVCACTCEACCETTIRDLTYGTGTPVAAATTFPAITHCSSTTCRRNRLTLPAFGNRAMRQGEVKKTDIETFVKITERLGQKSAHRANRTRTIQGLRPHRTDAHNVQETAIVALRRLFGDAVDDGLLLNNPVEKVKAPKRQETRKRSMSDSELKQFLDAVVAGGNDPELDLLLAWFHLETGARQYGVLSLTLDKLHTDGRAELFEKGSKYRDQPITQDLYAALIEHARRRGGAACDPQRSSFNPQAPVFYYLPKANKVRPLTAKRYETLFNRIQKTLPFANEVHLTSHQLRKTSAVQVERLAGTQVARKFLGHGQRTDVDGYAQASYDELVSVHRVRFSLPDSAFAPS